MHVGYRGRYEKHRGMLWEVADPPSKHKLRGICSSKCRISWDTVE